VAFEFKRNGYNVIQSDYYFDQESKSNREIDVKAFVQRMIQRVLFRISFIVECKLSKDKPWILFTSQDSKISDKAKIAQILSTFCGTFYLLRLCEKKEYWDKGLFDIGIRPAFGITQGFTTGKDIPYQAITGVAKATDAICKKNSDSKQGLICNVCIPIVVTEDKLFESFYENDIVVNEVESGVLLWRNMLTSNPHTIIRIYTFEKLKNTIPKLTQEIYELMNNSDDLILNVLEDIKNRNIEYKLWE
jgi:hypothetical protein